MAVEFFVTKDGKIGLTLDSVVEVIEDQMRLSEENTRAEYQWYGEVKEMPDNYFAARGAVNAIAEVKEELLERFANIGDAIDSRKSDEAGDEDDVPGDQGALPARA